MVDVKDLIPKDKFDISSIGKLIVLKDDVIDSIIPDLLEWIQDMNWPVAPHIVRVLKCHYRTTEKYLLKFLKPEQTDEIWKYNIISYLLTQFPSPDDEQIASEIERISTRPTESEKLESVDAAAAKYLNEFV